MRSYVIFTELHCFEVAELLPGGRDNFTFLPVRITLRNKTRHVSHSLLVWLDSGRLPSSQGWCGNSKSQCGLRSTTS